MIILLLGPQGSGKGTQAKLLVEKFGFFYFEAGGFLRNLISKNENVRQIMAEGRFVPDAEMSSYVTSYLDEKGLSENIILDGFPRSIPQYEAFKPWLLERSIKIDMVFVMRIKDEVSVMRLINRRMDPATGKIYNLITDPPGPEIDTAKLIQREDDKEDAIRKRLQWSKDNTEPLIEILKKETKFYEIDGERPVSEIQKELISAIEEKIKNEASSN